MKKLGLFWLALGLFQPAFADGELYYTTLPNLAYLSSIESKDIPELKGMLPTLIEDLAKEKKLTTHNIYFENAEDAIESAKVGYGKKAHSLDLIGGIYYDEKIATFMEYIYPPLFEDHLLLVLPTRSSFSLQQLADFRSLDKNLPAVVIEGIALGQWWNDLTKDKNMQWREHVISNTTDEAKPLRVLQVKTIDKAMEEVLNGRGYFVGSGLMVRDYIGRHPEAISQIKGQYITENGKRLTRSVFIAINRDFLDLFSSLDLERVLSEKIHELKTSGDIQKRIDESKSLF
ncbi:MAG: hypothetical protein JW812_02235 [Alphaproteobacteria bacterium]|nr:hypothetical protein [Alphaproteobacteria bacterium]MBN2779735.1 hypothetical protein [Alphaproteobacteria bacterium]